ncbi:MAG: PAS domain-containing protein [Gemmatimonadaceae bacterium]
MAQKHLLLPSEYGPASVSRRRLGNLCVFLVVGTVASVLGYLPWQVPTLLVPWIAGVWIASRAIQRPSSPEGKQWIETASYCLDAVWLTGVCFYVGGANWIASAFYLLLVITAAASLTRPKAALVAVAAWAGFAALALGDATGAIEVPQFGPVANASASLSFAVLTVVVQGTTVILALLLQQELLGALRRSEARHRAILNAASDLVMVLDCDGVIQGASGVFADRTTFPIRDIVGSRFGDIVDIEHQGAWAAELKAACTGEHAPFEVAYRSTHSNQGWLAGTLVPLPPENGEDRILMIARDVSGVRCRA